MNNFDLEKTLSTMVICVDSREKKNSHILSWFDKNGIEYEVKKLDVGDYMIDGGVISVDTKRSIDELSTNMLNRSDHARFWREVRRAKDTGIKLIILIESNKYTDIPSLIDWKSKYSGVNGRSLIDAIYRAHISYGVDFIFCSKRSTGRRIVELLQG